MNYHYILSKKEIFAGFSVDKKYCAIDRAGTKCFLRLSEISNYETKKFQFEQISKLANLDINMPKPFDIGICADGVYEIYEWIDGETLDKCINRFSVEEQYDYGFQAGEYLKLIHSIPAPMNIPSWSTRFNEKIDKKIANYNNCPEKYQNGQYLLDYIKNNRYLLTDVDQTFQHGDFHIANMMINKNGNLVIIDFDRMDYGDPWEEFNRIVWCVEQAPAFAKGLVNGYFANNIPEKFWQILALYIANNCLSSLPWAYPLGKEQINIMKNQTAKVLSWYNNMNDIVPSWYIEK